MGPRGIALLALLAVACTRQVAPPDIVDVAPDASIDAPDVSTPADAGADSPVDVTRFDATVPAACGAPTVTRSIAVGMQTTCRVDSTGQLYCWGRNDRGQVRPHAPSWVEPLPVAVDGLGDVTSVVMADERTCVVHADGRVSCWGINTHGQLGDGTTILRDAPTAVSRLNDIESLAIGENETCAHDRAGRWFCWGQNAAPLSTLLGLGTTAPDVLTPREVTTLRGVRRFALGWPVAAVLDTGEAVTWGSSSSAPGYATLPGIHDAIDVQSSELVACVLRQSGSVLCWGPYRGTAPTSAAVPGLEDARAIEGGTFGHFCAVRTDGTLWCWSVTTYDNRGPDITVPESIPGGTDVETVAAGWSDANVCVSTCAGSMRCSGDGYSGEDGDGFSGVPTTELPSITSAVAIEGHCALLSDGTVSCWEPGSRALVPDNACIELSAPTLIEGLSDAVALAGNCALRRDDSIVCWSPANMGTALSGVRAPATLRSFSGVPGHVVALNAEPLALTDDGRVFGWNTGTPLPTLVSAVSDVVQLEGGSVRTRDGRVFDVGRFEFSWAASPWPGVNDATSIWSMGGHQCARRASGEVWCRIGMAEFASISSALGVAPMPLSFQHVPVFDGAVDIAANGAGLCALDATGAVNCYGLPESGRLGSNDVTVTHTRPIDSGATALGDCAIVGGRVQCWGTIPFVHAATCGTRLDHIVRL